LPRTPARTCTLDSCYLPHHSHGLCAPHARKRLHGLPQCAEPGCSAEAIKLGYCRRHEGRLLEQLPDGELDAILDDAAAHIVADPVTDCWLWTGSAARATRTARLAVRTGWFTDLCIWCSLAPIRRLGSLTTFAAALLLMVKQSMNGGGA
jgi:hypothetical protein